MNWIVSANRIQARIFSEDPFELLKVLKNPLGREKNKALMTDKPGSGRSRYAKSTAIHSMSGEKDPHDEAAEQFARKICRYLELRHDDHQFANITIAAEPKLMGKIRSHMPKHLAQATQWLAKDYGHLSDYELAETLASHEKA